jgi:hypothetical protein
VGLEGDLGLQGALAIAVEVDLEDTAGFGAAEARPANDAATSRPIAMATSNGLLLRIASIGSPPGTGRAAGWLFREKERQRTVRVRTGD